MILFFKIERFLFFALSILLFTSCSSNSTDDLTDPIPATITYKANVKSIIDQSCAVSGCHNAATNTAGLTLETYGQVKDAVMNKNAIGRMENSSTPMPPTGNLPTTTISIVKKWREQGYID